MATRRTQPTRPINTERLKAEIAKKSLSAGEASQKCGFASTWIPRFYQNNEIPEYAIYLLESVIGIPYDNYAPDTDAPAEEKVEHEPCRFCNSGITSLFYNEEGKVKTRICQITRSRMFDIEVSFGKEEIAHEVIHIRFCPFCGRKL